jgi:hypothetical protein
VVGRSKGRERLKRVFKKRGFSLVEVGLHLW